MIIILVIASKSELYDYFRSIWEKYMDVSSNIKVFFLYGGRDTSGENEINCNVGENLRPGVLLKTLNALEHVRTNYKYDFVLRTNLSSFYNFSLLEEYVKTLPETNCYSGNLIRNAGHEYASGCGFIMSKDVVELLLDNKNELNFKLYDDMAIGDLMKNHQIPIIRKPFYEIKYTEDPSEFSSNLLIENMNNNTHHYHYRVKNADRRLKIPRLVIDSFIMDYLYSQHYSILTRNIYVLNEPEES